MVWSREGLGKISIIVATAVDFYDVEPEGHKLGEFFCVELS